MPVVSVSIAKHHTVLFFLIFISALYGSIAFAQNIFPVDSGNSIVYLKYMNRDSINDEALIHNSKKLYDYINEAPPSFNHDNHFNGETGEFKKPVGYNLYEKDLIGKNPVGYAVGMFQLQINKDSCILILSDLKYAEMVKNRYAQFEPGASGYEPLERLVKIHRNKDWKIRFEQLNDKIDRFLIIAQKLLKGEQP